MLDEYNTCSKTNVKDNNKLKIFNFIIASGMVSYGDNRIHIYII